MLPPLLRSAAASLLPLHRSSAMERGTILLVEDDEASQYIYGSILAHHGYSVRYARSGPAGLARLSEELPDAVVLDIGLPGFDGFEVLERIRAEPRTRALPVVVATVHVFAADEKRAVAAGCDIFLKKPLEPRRLLKELEKLLHPSAASSSG